MGLGAWPGQMVLMDVHCRPVCIAVPCVTGTRTSPGVAVAGPPVSGTRWGCLCYSGRLVAGYDVNLTYCCHCCCLHTVALQ
uniref:Uncharacterized protein n=1 Tax=Oryza brachyantha TaxID=4533 RepID=J3N4Q0_ORYBR